jgi:hypothetical protein
MTQCERILSILEAGESITALDALREIGCFRLAARINDLKKLGHDIYSVPYTYTNRWGEQKTIASYRLNKRPYKIRDYTGQGELL